MIESIDDWFFDKGDENENMNLPYRILAALWFIPRNFIGKWHWRIFIRGMCALKGCNEHYSCGGYLPDDVCEWYCDRCNAEGMNQVIYTHEMFSRSDNRLHNFMEALRGK